MDSPKIYRSLIERARTRVLDGYAERHHVIPRCMGGDNSAENIVRLTPEEHYVAHLLLVKIHPGNHSLVRAAMLMSGKCSRFTQRSNKFYGWLRRKHAAWMKNRTVSVASIEKGAAKNRLKTRTEEFKTAVGAFHTGRKRPPETGRKISEAHKKRCRTPEFRARMSGLARGRTHTPESCAKMAKSRTGKRASEDTKAKMRAAKIGRPKSPETRARMSAAQRARRAGPEGGKNA